MNFDAKFTMYNVQTMRLIFINELSVQEESIMYGAKGWYEMARKHKRLQEERIMDGVKGWCPKWEDSRWMDEIDSFTNKTW